LLNYQGAFGLLSVNPTYVGKVNPILPLVPEIYLSTPPYVCHPALSTPNIFSLLEAAIDQAGSTVDFLAKAFSFFSPFFFFLILIKLPSRLLKMSFIAKASWRTSRLCLGLWLMDVLHLLQGVGQ
jgi:hypothetical protein